MSGVIDRKGNDHRSSAGPVDPRTTKKPGPARPISKTPREVLPLLGFISPVAKQPAVDDKNHGERALFISPSATLTP